MLILSLIRLKEEKIQSPRNDILFAVRQYFQCSKLCSIFTFLENRPGTCRRSLCECDKKLAEDLAGVEYNWVPLYHKNWGGFDKDTYCVAEQTRLG